MSRKPKATMMTQQQQREQGNQSDAAHSSGMAISKSTNVKKLVFKLTHHFDSFRREVYNRLDFLEDKVQLLEDRFTYLNPRRPYVKKYGDIEIDKNLLRTKQVFQVDFIHAGSSALGCPKKGK
jgi:hypothetical protein